MLARTNHNPDQASDAALHLGWPVVLAATSIGLIGRLWNLGAALFISDEPLFLSAARDELISGRWVGASPLAGTHGVHYGPTVIWFYSCLQWAFGYSPIVALVAMCALTTVTQALLARAATRVFGGGTPTFLLTFGLLLSSPYLYYWSRLAWDQSVLISVAAAVTILCQPATLRPRHALAVGLLLGLAISSHLMVVPFALCVLGVLTWELRADAARLTRIVGGLVLPALVVNIPYLWHIATQQQSRVPAAPSPGSFLANLAETPTVVTTFRFEMLIEPLWTQFVQQLGFLEPLLRVRPILLVVISVAAVFGLVISWSSDDPRQRRVARLGLTTWIASAGLFALQGLNQEPHYQFATWWAVPVGLASALRLAHSRPPLFRTVIAGGSIVIALQLSFVVAWHQFQGGDSGTNGLHPPTSLAEQIDVAHAICLTPQRWITVRNETSVFSESVGYLVVTTEGCDDKRVEFCNPPNCPRDQPGRTQLRLLYENDQGPGLKVVPFDPAVPSDKVTS